MPIRFRRRPSQRVDCRLIPRALADLGPRRSDQRRLVAGVAATVGVLLVWASVDAGRRENHTTVRVQRTPAPVHRTDTPRPDPLVAGPPTTKATAPVDPVTTVDELSCRNSANARCGSFVWDPAPAPNQPLTITIDVAPAAPTPGQEVVVHVRAEDPDAQVTTNGGTYFFDDPHDDGPQIGFPHEIAAIPARFGPWTPPSPHPSRLELSFVHTFSQPGEFRFLVEARSGDEADPGNPDRNPYADIGRATVAITVVPAEPAPGIDP